MKSVASLLEEGLAAGAYPSAELSVLHHGLQVFHHTVGEVPEGADFDLASLTKILATTTAFISLWAQGRLFPETPLAQFFPESPAGKRGVTLEDLLTHRSGLPTWKPFFTDALARHPELLTAPTAPSRTLAREGVIAAAAAVELEAAPRTRAAYSDVGFILLGEVLAREAGAPLDDVVEAHVMRHLELPLHFHRLSRVDEAHRALSVPTGATRPREPAPGQEQVLGELLSVPARPGEVDDDNAWVMDGVAGHAGLFGRAPAIANLGELVLEELRGARKLAPPGHWQRLLTRDATTPGSTRALGFDTPSASGSSTGASFPPSAFGHLGFTGTSLWVDPTRSLVVAFCSNRTLPGRQNNLLREFRPRLHDAVVRALRLT